MSNLQQRIITACILLPVAIYWICYASSPYFEIGLFVFLLLASIELGGLLEWQGGRTTTLLFLLPWFCLCAGLGSIPAFICLMVLHLGLLLFSSRHQAVEAAMQTTAMALWMHSFLFLFAVLVLQLHQHAQGMVFLLVACSAVWLADIAAYFAGRAWGKHKLLLAVSPGKSIEGAVAGLLAGTLMAATLWFYLLDLAWFIGLPLGLLLIVLAIAGDLSESAIKRVSGKKDSGRLLPGHGGWLDRTDALIPSIPVVAYLWMHSL